MESRKQRLEVLRSLVENAGSIAAFARAHHSVDPTYVSQLLNGHRSFGERAARNMEARIGLPAGFFDGGYEKSAFSETESSEGYWPFGDFSQYEALSPAKKENLAQIVEAFIAGAQENKSGTKKTA